jgi:hypothetical protein
MVFDDYGLAARDPLAIAKAHKQNEADNTCVQLQPGVHLASQCTWPPSAASLMNGGLQNSSQGVWYEPDSFIVAFRQKVSS